MNTRIYPNNPAPNAWNAYISREHRIRTSYLNIVDQAAREHLNGPYPARDTYTAIERQAWAVYYQAGRDSWRQYVAEMEAELNPPADDPYPVKGEAVTGTGWPQKLPVSEETGLWLRNDGGR